MWTGASGERARARLGADSPPLPSTLAQIKVRDLSRATVSVMPAEYGSWQEARADLVMEAKKPLKAQMQSEISAAASDAEAADIRAAFEQRERALEHEIDHRPLDLHMKLGVSYNFLSR